MQSGQLKTMHVRLGPAFPGGGASHLVWWKSSQNGVGGGGGGVHNLLPCSSPLCRGCPMGVLEHSSGDTEIHSVLMQIGVDFP